jgi:hypothetical protein
MAQIDSWKEMAPNWAMIPGIRLAVSYGIWT